MLDRLFALNARGTSVKREAIAGLTTFMAMSYVLFVNPAMLAQTGMEQGAVFVATCLAAALGCLLMGLLANLPVALAPGMGLNAFFTYVIVVEQGHSWQTALACVFFSGCLFLLLSIFKIREWIINSIPLPLKMGIAAGIGMFLALIALKTANIIVASPATLVTLGDLHSPQVLLAVAGFFIIFALAHRGWHSAVLISILLITAVAWWLGDTQFNSVVALPPSIAPTFMQLDFAAALSLSMLPVILSLLFLDLFDTSGTLVAVSHKAGLMQQNGTVPDLNKALIADSSATIAGALFGTSTTTSYVESTSGVAAGGRTGLMAVVTGLLFLAALWFSPLAAMVPSYATAGALLYVATLMLSSLKHVEWDDVIHAVPVCVVLIMMPLTFSISDGIGMGFISYAVLCLVTGKLQQTTLSVWLLALIFLAKFIWG
ncbi:putative MFS transporter, AGZA family, xanthine/uracil permease [Rheinheimera pacifica]|uniref:Putative MFS transporter, AGZA family, xanthine/uracil permease n=1 Tax=Rheinheimera pacifica TaxID=173990 RepID=A0A1H6M179_9GAMM|nr:NCS2 family permease [Rheinheimera pacifica]SEH92591.1 putative MFS transporter, AGZA family, xanthine/uracil permease [Rheinheimera pacifica]